MCGMKSPKFIWIAGVRFCRDDKSGYYRNGTIRKLAHRFSYETFIGPIPEGFHVHHKDHKKWNNDPSNLEAMCRHEHAKHHGWVNGQMPDRVARARENMRQRAGPAAREWHKSPEGREWHRIHALDSICIPRPTELECECCHRAFVAHFVGVNRFCSNACKSKWRRAAGVDNVEKKCVVCEVSFQSNKYKDTPTCGYKCGSTLAYQRRSK